MIKKRECLPRESLLIPTLPLPLSLSLSLISIFFSLMFDSQGRGKIILPREGSKKILNAKIRKVLFVRSSSSRRSSYAGSIVVAILVLEFRSPRSVARVTGNLRTNLECKRPSIERKGSKLAREIKSARRLPLLRQHREMGAREYQSAFRGSFSPDVVV